MWAQRTMNIENAMEYLSKLKMCVRQNDTFRFRSNSHIRVLSLVWKMRRTRWRKKKTSELIKLNLFWLLRQEMLKGRKSEENNALGSQHEIPIDDNMSRVYKHCLPLKWSAIERFVQKRFWFFVSFINYSLYKYKKR